MITRGLFFAFVYLLSVDIHSQTLMNIHQNDGSTLQILVNTIDSITYTIPTPGNLALLTTTPIYNITNYSAATGGNISNSGGTAITQRGVVWSTSPNPTTADFSSTDGFSNGNFTSSLTNLIASTTYYVRAYAINSAGTAYGNELSFTTDILVTNPGAGVTFNGYNYASVVFGNGQEWMNENLRTSIFANGETIPNITDDVSWLQSTSAAWSILDSDYEVLYGKVYNGFAVVDPRNVCPSGWHVPSELEFFLLTDYLGGPQNAGNVMKSEVWSGNQNTNTSGFSALPGGYRAECGLNLACFANIGNCAAFATSNLISNTWLVQYTICDSNSTNDYFGNYARDGVSVRCVKN
jgi:uncharacterized protein (TIGR02145 family)